MSFADYLYDLAHVIFKRTAKPNDSDLYKLTRALGPNFDDLQEAMFLLREISMVATATGKALDLHGKDRKMPRYRGETDDEYRLRLLSAMDIYTMAGTEPGMKMVLATLGYRNSEIYPLYKEKYKWRFLNTTTPLDGSITLEPTEPDAKLEYLGRWAEFIVKLNIGDASFTETQYQIVRSMINKVKPSEGKLYALQLMTAAATWFALVSRVSLVVSGRFGGEVSPHVRFLNGRRTLSSDPLPLLLDGTGWLDGRYVLCGYKERPPDTWFMEDSRNRQGMLLAHRFFSWPVVTVNMDGRYWLNGKLDLKGARRLTGARVAVRTKAGISIVPGHSGREGYKVKSGALRTAGRLSAYYRELDGILRLDGRWVLAPDRTLDGREQLFDGQVAHRVVTRLSFPYSFGHGPDMGTGLWCLDGGGPRYVLDARICMSATAMMDGSVTLNGLNRMQWLASLGDTVYLLSGRRLMGGDGLLLDGQLQMRSCPTSHELRITVYKNNRFVEKVVV